MSDAPTESRILPLQYLKGIGPRRAEALAKEGLVTIEDVLLYVPRSYVDRNAAPSIAALHQSYHRPDLWNGDAASIAKVTSEVTLIAAVHDLRESTVGKGRRMLSVVITDGSGSTAKLVFWNMVDYYKRTLAQGQYVVVSGTPEYEPRFNQITFHHPEIERIDEEDMADYRSGVILPKYTLTQGMRNAGITMRLMRDMVEQVIDKAIGTMVDPVPVDIRQRLRMIPRDRALRELHFPSSLQAIDAARQRMKFEELFFFQLLLAVRRRSRKRPDNGLVISPKSPRARALTERLPFQLTGAQRRVIHEITNDMASGAPMNRLLQGDVGSGKTIVALLCMLCAVDNGYQTLIMAPTEILAEQHYNGIRRLLEGTDIRIVQLVGGQKKAMRAAALSEIAAGDAQIIVGTHAMFEADVRYRNLGLIVIDEQHRFGVAQRASLQRLGKDSHDEGPRVPHILVMSATPIPRTLSMTVYGDLDVSVIDAMPAERRPIGTHVVFESQISDVHRFIREQVAEGRQAYIVYPLVEKSEKLELKSAVEHHETLQHDVFPDLKVGLLHGQMLWYEKEDAMKAFLNRDFDILVATTVVEVGIDVPNATVMLIENAERFGLVQLHQLRGRVGRSGYQSYCFLATKDHFRYQINRRTTVEDRAASVIRLKTMEETTDGFRIAEVDLSLRGPGDVLGTRQSGLPEFRFADLVTDVPVIARAREEAFGLLERDPHLRAQEHQHAREVLIALFEGASGFVSVA